MNVSPTQDKRIELKYLLDEPRASREAVGERASRRRSTLLRNARG